MPTFVVLLRGVNVGKAKRVPMTDFKALLIGVGCTSATTLLNSGNAVVEAPRQASATLAGKVADAIEMQLGLQVPVVVKSVAELRRIIVGNELAREAPDHSKLVVAFAQTPRSLEPLDAVARLTLPAERFLIRQHAAYLHCPTGILGSKAAEALLGRAGKGVTTRNWATVLKLQALASRSAA